MSGETEKDISGWTVDTLHAYMQRQLDDIRTMLNERYATQTKVLDAAFAAAQKEVQTALLSAEKAVTKAEVATEKRFEAVNEFRATVTEIAANNVTRTEHAVYQQRNDERYQELADRINRAEGSTAGVKLSTGVLVSVITIAALIIGVIVAVANVAAH